MSSDTLSPFGVKLAELSLIICISKNTDLFRNPDRGTSQFFSFLIYKMVKLG